MAAKIAEAFDAYQCTCCGLPTVKLRPLNGTRAGNHPVEIIVGNHRIVLAYSVGMAPQAFRSVEARPIRCSSGRGKRIIGYANLTCDEEQKPGHQQSANKDQVPVAKTPLLFTFVHHRPLPSHDLSEP